MPNRDRIGHYLRPLRDHSLLIGGLVALAALAGLGLSALFGGLLPYEAQAVLLFKPNGSDRLVLTGATPDFLKYQIDPNSQARNFPVLMTSLDVAGQVQARARSSTEADVRALGESGLLALRGAVAVEVKSDLIYVKAKAPTAAAATWLANTWAEEGVTKINKLYALSSAKVDEALAGAKSDLEASQTALQTFMERNPTTQLVQELEQSRTFVAAASTSFTNTQVLLYTSARAALQNRLEVDYTTVYSLEQTTSEIGALRTRIENSPETPDALYGNQVTLLLLMNKLGAAAGGPQVQLQINVGQPGTALTKADQLRQLDAATAALKKLQGDTTAQISTLEGRLRNPLPALTPGTVDVPPALMAEIARQDQLQSDVEKAQFEFTQLQKTREERQSTYDLLRSRLAEQQVNAVIGRIVDLGSPASALQTSAEHSFLRLVVLSVGQMVLLALAVGVLLAYLLHLWRPGFSSTAAIARRLRRPARAEAAAPHPAPGRDG